MIYIPNNIKGITNIFDSIQITDHTNCLSVLVALWWRVVSLANIPNIPNLLFYKKKKYIKTWNRHRAHFGGIKSVSRAHNPIPLTIQIARFEVKCTLRTVKQPTQLLKTK